MNGNDTELDKIASCNVQSSLYSLSFQYAESNESFGDIARWCGSARLRKTLAVLYKRQTVTCVGFNLFLLLTLLLFTFEPRHKEPLQRSPRYKERDSKLQL